MTKKRTRIISTFLTSWLLVAFLASFLTTTYASYTYNTKSRFFGVYNDYLYKSSITFPGSDVMTIEGWFKVSAWPAGGVIPLYTIESSSYRDAIALYNQATPAFYFSNYISGCSQGIASDAIPGGITPNTWYHFAVSKNGTGAGSFSFYIGTQAGNDALVGATKLSSCNLQTTGQENVGASIGTWDNTNYLYGYEDEIRVWHEVRSLANINLNKNKSLDATTNLWADYHFNDSLNDSSGNALNLTAHGAGSYSADIPFSENPPAPTISITYPGNATEVPNFNYFRGTMSNLNPQKGIFTVSISIGTTTNNLVEQPVDIPIYNVPSNGVSVSYEVPNVLTILPSTTYYAMANLYDGLVIINDQPLLATSTKITFVSASSAGSLVDTSVEGGGLNNNVIFATSTIATSTLSCDPNSGIIGQAICGLFLNASTTVLLNNFSGLSGILSNKIPFGVLASYNTAITSLEKATTTQAFTMANLSALNAPFLVYIDAILAMIIYVDFGWKIIDRFKHVHL